jgi:hypothetical protein
VTPTTEVGLLSELPHVPLREHVWPKFLREKSLRVFKLGK